jgi:hypothetical protein
MQKENCSSLRVIIVVYILGICGPKQAHGASGGTSILMIYVFGLNLPLDSTKITKIIYDEELSFGGSLPLPCTIV